MDKKEKSKNDKFIERLTWQKGDIQITKPEKPDQDKK
jgi:hypothetical protein